MTLTYNGRDKILGGVTYGGYTDTIVVDEPYVLRVGNKGWTPQAPRLFFAPASPRIHRCAIGKSAKDKRSASSVLAGWGIWA